MSSLLRFQCCFLKMLLADKKIREIISKNVSYHSRKRIRARNGSCNREFIIYISNIRFWTTLFSRMTSYLKFWLATCTFCKNAIESLEHLFYNCEITRSLWVALRSWLMECYINLEPLSIFNVLFGIFNAGEDFVIVNRLILVAKFYFYRWKLNGVKPAMRVLKTKIDTQYRR